MTLEPIRAADAPALAAVHARAFEHGWGAGEIAELIASPGGFGLKVTLDGAVPGFILARTIGGEAEILTLAVDPAQRRQGLGQALATAAMAAAEAAGAQAMFLEVAADNQAAIALYRAKGFTQVGLRPRYYPRENGAMDALVMRRDLNRLTS